LLRKLEATKENDGEIRLFGKNFKVERNYNGLLVRPNFEIKKEVFIENLPINCEKNVLDAYLRRWKINFIKKILVHKVFYFNRKFNFRFDSAKNRVSIKEQKSLWGSCSGSNNLNFNYKIIEKDNKIADYLVLHELTHTIHKNHSREFWEELRRVCPDCETLKRKLKET
jgi:predicted metal-dependent hydrolase